MTYTPVSLVHRVADRVRWLVLPCAFGLLLPLLGRLWPSSSNMATWLLDLAAHWQPLYATSWLALCLVCAARTWRWLLLAPLALLPLFTASTSLSEASGGAPTLIVAAANLHVGNRDPAPLVAWLRAEPADVVMLSELTPAYADALARKLGDDYPHREFAPDDSPFGIGLLSRTPLTAVELQASADGIPFLTATIVSGNAPVRVVAVHPMPPMAAHWQRERDALLRMLALRAGRTPTVVAGDLNATPWSNAMIRAAQGGLFRATHHAPTWPVWGRGVFGVPIDHVIATTHWRQGESSRGPDIGSDHFPVRVSLHRIHDKERD